MDLSIIIPAYHEESNLPVLLEEIHQALAGVGASYEILVVDDGSTDDTLAVARSLADQDPRIRVLHLTRNSGQSAALDAGFRLARAPVLATLDADLQNDPVDLPKMLAKLEEGWDVVSGIRMHRHDSWVRRMSSRIANGVRNRVTHDSVTDVGCTLRVYRKESTDRIFMFTGMHRFLPTLLKLAGARVTEIPVHHRPRLHGEPKYNIRNRIWKALADLLAVRWMQTRWIDRRRVEEIPTPAAETTDTGNRPARESLPQETTPWTQQPSGSESDSPDRPSSAAAFSSSGSPPSDEKKVSSPEPSGSSAWQEG
jgi:dolichol-phosphate mannosyltransferase